jgi:GH25 family lysozyme M1 (1,4-beta-N-acetylmuramidase)
MSRKHKLLHAVAITLALLGVALVVLGFKVGGRADTAIQVAAKQAATQAAAVPNRVCSTAAGDGYMGCGAPAQAFAIANDLAIDAHDPDNITTPIGTDVSDNNGWQCNIDWPDEATVYHLAFVYIKATESTTDTDSCLTHNIAGARSAHLLWGLYDFLRPGDSSAAAEADHFIAVVKAYGTLGTLPPTADVEVTDGETPTEVRAYVTTWLTVVIKALGRADVYSGPYFWSDEVGATGLDVGYWDADWSTEALLPAAFSRYTFWQYAMGGIGPTPHISDWDADTFNGTVTQLQALAGIVPPKPKPAPKVSKAKQAARLDGAAAMTLKRFRERGCPRVGAQIETVKVIEPSKRTRGQRAVIVRERKVWRARKCAGLLSTARADRAAATALRKERS